MKKIIVLCITVILAFSFTACKKTRDFSPFLTQIRNNCYEYSESGLKITVFAEQKENPFIADGYIGTLANFLTVKVEGELNKSLDGAKFTVSYDGNTYGGSFGLSPLGNKYIAEISVEKLPEIPQIQFTAEFDGESKEFTLSTKKLSTTISVTDAVLCVYNENEKLFDEYLTNGSVSAEINARLIVSDDKNYYYIGLITKTGEIYAYLLDGESGKILAEKK